MDDCWCVAESLRVVLLRYTALFFWSNFLPSPSRVRTLYFYLKLGFEALIWHACMCVSNRAIRLAGEVSDW